MRKNQHIESKSNNPAFFRTGMIESWRRGIEKIIDLCVSVGLPKPVFDTRFGGLKIEFVPKPEIERSKTGVKTLEEILRLIKNNPEISIMTLVDKLKKSLGTIERNLQNLQKAKKIERIGPAKGGYWKLIE